MSAQTYPEPTDPQELQIWRFLNKHPRFTYADVAAACQVSSWKLTNYLRKLRRQKIVKPCGREGATHFYTIFDGKDVQAFAAKKRGVKEGAIWQAIRMLGVFTSDELRTALISIPEQITAEQIQAYCTTLAQAKYLIVLERAKPGKRPARYRLVKNTGPLPPVKRKLTVVVDGNEDRIVHAQGERI